LRCAKKQQKNPQQNPTIATNGGALMNKQRIYKLVNDLFYDVIENENVREQKEELYTHLTERVNDYMTEGLSFDEALQAAKDDLGDPEELVSGFERKRMVVVDDLDEDYGVHIQLRFKRLLFKLVPLAPFIYILLGVTQHLWQPDWWTWGWWTWGWVIIPMIPIMSSGMGFGKLVALSPFIYILLGVFFGWWLWGWLIIPIFGILFSSSGGKKKKKKKKKKIVSSVVIDIDDGDVEIRIPEGSDREN
jgi:hypothetical protein